MPRPRMLVAAVLCALVLCGACRSPVPPVASSATPAATPSSEASPTPTATATPAPTVTASVTATLMPTATASVTATLMPTATASVTATPAPTVTTAPSATCTPLPTRTPRPTPLPGPTPGCLAGVTPPAARASTRPLRVVYMNDDKLWLWREEDGQAVTLAGDLHVPWNALSPDGHYAAFTRQVGDQPIELWVVSTEGKGERRLAIPDAAESLARHWGVTPTLHYGWVPGTRLLWYCLGYAWPFPGPDLDAVLRVVDADGGEPRAILPACNAEGFFFSPDGRYAVAWIRDELRLVDVAAGHVTAIITFAPWTLFLEDIEFSPDGRRVAVFTLDGVTVLDLADGARRDIPLTYAYYGSFAAGAHAVLYWQEDGTILARVCNAHWWSDVIEPGVTFTLWRLDVDRGTVSEGPTFSGKPWAPLSPDGRWVLFTNDDGYVLNIGDVQTGRSVAYEQPGKVERLFWHSDSIHFFYALDDDRLMVGQICGPWVQVGLPARNALEYAGGAYCVPGRDDFVVESYAPQGVPQIHLAGLDGTVRPVASSGDNRYRYIGCFLGD